MNELNEKSLVSDVEKKISDIEELIKKYDDKLKQNEINAALAKKTANAALRKKIFTMAAVMLVIVATFISSTLAYFTATTASVGNVIATGDANAEIVHLVYPSDDPSGTPNEGTFPVLLASPGETVKKSMKAINRGNLSLYVRASIDCEITLKDKYAHRQDEIDTSLVLCGINDKDWLVRDTFDGYYYFKDKLTSGKETSDFIDSLGFSNDMGNIYKGATVKLTVLFEIVQANGNGETVFDASGWPIGARGGNS